MLYLLLPTYELHNVYKTTNVKPCFYGYTIPTNGNIADVLWIIYFVIGVAIAQAVRTWLNRANRGFKSGMNQSTSMSKCIPLALTSL